MPRARLRIMSMGLAFMSIGACDGTEPSSRQPTIAQVSAGTGATCVLAEGGRTYCWGRSLDASVPDDPACGSFGHSCRTRPDTLRVSLRFRQLQLASNIFGASICGITTASQTFCWGTLLVGLDGGFHIGDAPQTLAVSQPLEALSVGSRHGCGLTTAGTAYCWGDYRAGVRGTGVPLADEFVAADMSPNAVAGGLAFSEIAVGLGNSCGLISSGRAYCWGSEVALGNPDAPLSRQEQCGYTVPPFFARCAHTPVPVAGGHSFTSLAAGQSHVCGLREDGDMYCWGSNGSGQLGSGDTTYAPAPVRAAVPEHAAAITAGSDFTCAIGVSGQAYCWGVGHVGQIGYGAHALSVLEPTRVAGSAAYRLISAGESHVCALRVSGELDCWGSNFTGELGSGDLRESPVPRQVQF